NIFSEFEQVTIEINGYLVRTSNRLLGVDGSAVFGEQQANIFNSLFSRSLIGWNDKTQLQMIFLITIQCKTCTVRATMLAAIEHID
ncbi:MAG: hypothetical protein IIC09_04620, partial [Proteobacteria bacterium]|nr:hypothetical protein [Pseudomonadota bacterium]